jgi:hypothetical protein
MVPQTAALNDAMKWNKLVANEDLELVECGASNYYSGVCPQLYAENVINILVSYMRGTQ